jgi:hypothetical protein
MARRARDDAAKCLRDGHFRMVRARPKTQPQALACHAAGRVFAQPSVLHARRVRTQRNLLISYVHNRTRRRTPDAPSCLAPSSTHAPPAPHCGAGTNAGCGTTNGCRVYGHSATAPGGQADTSMGA